MCARQLRGQEASIWKGRDAGHVLADWPSIRKPNQCGYIAVAALDVITAFAVPNLSGYPLGIR